jgi:hypothetical protein
LADFFVALPDDVFALTDRSELVAEAFADLGKGLDAGSGEGGALGAELVDLMVGEIDLILELTADAFEAINLEIEGCHLLAGGGEEGLGLMAVSFAAGKLRADRVEGLLEIVGVVAGSGQGRFELGGVGSGVTGQVTGGRKLMLAPPGW